MERLHIKGPDGRVIACPRGLTKDVGIGTDHVSTVVDESKLKSGWSVYVPAPPAKKGA